MRLTFLMVAAMLTGSGALAAEITGRYGLERVEQGFLRLDRETGAMSLCAAKEGVWECHGIKDQGIDQAADLVRLKAENERLQARIAELEKSTGTARLPTDQDVDRLMDVFGRMFDRFLDFAREMDGKANDGTSL